jgi:elongation factor G
LGSKPKAEALRPKTGIRVQNGTIEDAMAKYTTNDIRNVALVGHGAAGKTSLADALLFKAKAVERKGSVDDGSSVCDYDDEEKKRRFTIDAKVLNLDYKGKHVNLIDTPGYPEFIGQAIAGLSAVETALIVVNAPSGIEVNTRRLFREAANMGLGRVFVINKLDADNIQFDELVENIQQTFGKACVLLNVPIGQGAKFTGVVDVLRAPDSPPADALADIADARGKLVDNIVEADESLMEKYLGEGAVSADELAAALPKALATGSLVPIVCVSAKKDIGVEQLLEVIASFALNPVQGPKRTLVKGSGDAAKKLPIEAKETGEAIGQVFKTLSDKFVGLLSYLRLYSGKLTAETPIVNQRSGKSARSGGLLQCQGKTTKPMPEAVAGDIFAVAKVEDLHLGDTISGQPNVGQVVKVTFPTPMFGLAVEPKARGDEQKISGSLAKMADEDPTFHVTRDTQTKEMVITGMSQLHLDVVQARLKRRFELEVLTKEPKIPYRETVVGNGEGSHRHKKQSGGRGQFGEVHLRVYPLPREITSDEQCREQFMNKQRFAHMREDHCKYDPDHNFAFVDSIVGGTIPNQFIPAVYKGCLELLERGAIAGYRMQDVCAEVHFGKYHDVDSSEAAFKTAARIAFKNTVLASRPAILEPIVNLEVTAPSKYTGAILGDLNTKRARIENQDSLPGDLQVIKARAPLAEVTRYAAQLGSMTQGQGSYSMEFSHYDQVPGNVQQQIVAKAVKAKDEDEE